MPVRLWQGPIKEQQIEMVRVARYQYGNHVMTRAAHISADRQAIQTIIAEIRHVPDDGILGVQQDISRIVQQGQFVTLTINIFKYGSYDLILASYFGVRNGPNRM